MSAEATRDSGSPHSEDTPRVVVAPLPPLSSTIETFVGSDSEGPIFTRLEYQVASQQALHVPNILAGLMSRLQDTHQEYVRELESRLPELDAESAAIVIPTQRQIIGDRDKPRRTVNLKKSETPEIDELRQARLTTINRFRVVTRKVIIETLLDEETGSFPPVTIEKLEALSKTDVLRTDPLIQLARQARDILSDHDLPQLGKTTFLGSVAMVDFLGHANRVPNGQNDPSSAA